MARRTATRALWGALLCVCLPLDAGAQFSVPEPGRPVCVAAFCPRGSKYPNKQIPCDSDAACLCFDQCGGGSSGSSGAGRSAGGAGAANLVTAAIVGAAKVVFIVTAPGHATETLSKSKGTSAAEARAQFRSQVAEREAQQQRGSELAVEAQALRNFRRAVEQREENPHRHLLPLFAGNDLGPRMNVRDPLQQLRCVQQALRSAEAAVGHGMVGDISFLDARRAADVASGAWDSGLAPTGCAGESIASMAATQAAEQRQRLMNELVVGIQAQVALQEDLRERKDAVAQAEAKAKEARQNLATEQARKLAPLSQAHAEAKEALQQAQRAVVEQPAEPRERAQEPPPKKHRHSPPPPEADEKSRLRERLLRAQAEAQAQEEETRRTLEETQRTLTTESQELERGLAEQRARAQAELSAAEQSLQKSRGENADRMRQLGISAETGKRGN